MPNEANDFNALNAALFDTLRGLKDKTVEIEEANAICNVAKNITDIAKTEIAFANATKQQVESSLFKKVIGAPVSLPGELDADGTRKIGTGLVTKDGNVTTHTMK